MWVKVKAYGGWKVVSYNAGAASPTVDSSNLDEVAAQTRADTLNAA